MSPLLLSIGKNGLFEISFSRTRPKEARRQALEQQSDATTPVKLAAELGPSRMIEAARPMLRFVLTPLTYDGILHTETHNE